MRTVGLKVLKNELSEYVRLATGGETVLVIEGEHVVAELVPPQPGREAADAKDDLAPDPRPAWWTEGVRQGWITPACNRRGPLPRKPIQHLTLEQLMKELDEDRADRDLP